MASFGKRYPLSSHEGETSELNNKSSLVSSQRYKDYIDGIAGRQIITEGDQYRDDGLVSRDSTIYEHHQNRQQPYFNYDTQQSLVGKEVNETINEDGEGSLYLQQSTTAVSAVTTKWMY